MQHVYQPLCSNITEEEYEFYKKRALKDKEASIYIGMSESFLRHSRCAGSLNEIPVPRFIKIGRSVRYLIEDLDYWLNQFQKLDHTAQLQIMEGQK